MNDSVRVLMVEDSPVDAELIHRELQRFGMNVEISRVQTEIDLRHHLRVTDPDVILADYSLPHFNGMVALSVARELRPEVPFIFVSGSIGEERAVEALKNGATDYVLKDRLARLPAAVMRAVGDVRERRHVNLELADAEQKFRLAVAVTHDLVWVWEVGAPTIWFSRNMPEFGEDTQRIRRDDWMKHIHPDDLPRVRAASAAVSEGKIDRWLDEYRVRRLDGTWANFLVRATVTFDEAGKPLRAIGALVDITERKQLERQLELANRLNSLGRVAATIAHEFNNVLMGITPFAELVARTGKNDPTLQKASRHIRRAIERGRALTAEILRFSNPPSPMPERLDISNWIRSVVPDLQALVPDSVHVVVEEAKSSFFVTADPMQLQQVLTNLVLNGRDAVLPAGGVIEISMSSVARSQAHILGQDGRPFGCIQVRDNGIGMPPDLVARIFEPLFTTKPHGTGLGLAVSRQLIARNGGEMTVDSAEGLGTSFKILLPLDDEKEDSADDQER